MKAKKIRRFGIFMLLVGIAMLITGIILAVTVGNILTSVMLTGSILVNSAAVVCIRYREPN